MAAPQTEDNVGADVLLHGQLHRLFDEAMQKVLEEPVLLGTSQRSVAMKKSFGRWVNKVKSQNTFAAVLVKQLVAEAFGKEVLNAKTASSKYEKMWVGYHHFSGRANLIDMWSIALETPPNEEFFHLFVQVATRRVMEGAVFPHHGTNPEQMDSGPALKADDEQAVRYVAGYVAMALKKKYAKLPNDTTAVQYLNCLTAMHELDEENDRELPGFLEYTKLWVEKVNRGGLFLVDDKTFLLFRAMETGVRRILSTNMIPTGSIMEQTKTAVLNDPAVLVHWHHILSICQPMDSSTSDSLLEEITEKWATIRGHSFAAGWVEQYQCTKRESTKQKSLRKGLQQKADARQY